MKKPTMREQIKILNEQAVQMNKENGKLKSQILFYSDCMNKLQDVYMTSKVLLEFIEMGIVITDTEQVVRMIKEKSIH